MKTAIKSKLIILSALLSALSLQPLAFAQGTTFTYQGRLNDGGTPANGTNYGMVFYLYDSPTNGNLLGNLGIVSVTVSNGLFTVPLSFGSVFDGTPRWLEISVQKNGGGFTTLAPRQQITPTPYAMFANTASNLNGSVSSANLSGTYSNAVTFNNGSDEFNGTFSGEFFGPLFVGGSFSGSHFGDGSGLFNLNASQLGSGTIPLAALGNAWKTSGNAGTTPGVNFVGTADNQPLELHVNGQRALRLEPTATNGAVNVIGGSANNFVAGGVVGATIGGGGAVNYSGAAYSNSVTFNFGAVGGGYANLANGYAAVVAGGYQNANNGFVGFIGAGDGNTIVGNGGGDGAVIGGGYGNTNGGEAAFIGGGGANFIGSFANNAFIGGGGNNSIVGSYVLPVFGTISGGYLNTIQTNTAYATIGGGEGNSVAGNLAAIGGGIANVVQTNTYAATIAGGTNNVIQSSDTASTIGGGAQNSISVGDPYAVISGGLGNINGGFASSIGGGQVNNTSGGDGSVIGGGYFNTNNGSAATVGGGQYNTIIGPADHATISGGGLNNIAGSAALPVYCTIGGGDNNSIQTNTSFAIIGGGITNVIWSGAHSAVISGGSGNQVLGGGQFSTVGGGANNTNLAPYATIPGGIDNLAGANAFAAGTGAQAGNQGSFVWADSSGGGIGSTNNNSVTMRAAGGYRLYSNPGGTLGVFLAPNGNSWASISDRNAKKNFAPVDTQAVLDKLARVPIEQWNYKSEPDNATPNIGPMAQDFKAAFYPGRDDKSISTLEFDGVELAAIQGLNQKLEEARAENAELKARLDKLEQLLNSRLNGGF